MSRYRRSVNYNWIGALIVFPILAPLAVIAGAWWAPFPLGLLFGLMQRRARIAIPFGALIGLIGWSIPLIGLESQYGIGPAADALSAILGFGHQGIYAVALTLVVGVLLGVTGAWLGSAIRTIVMLSRPARGTAPQSPRKG